MPTDVALSSNRTVILRTAASVGEIGDTHSDDNVDYCLFRCDVMQPDGNYQVSDERALSNLAGHRRSRQHVSPKRR